MTDTLRATARILVRAAAGTAVLVAVALAWSFVASTPERADSRNVALAPAAGWGAEALVELRDAMRAVSPIAEANACGAGASSCFKCHNGTRAAAPPKAKWHDDHKSVDDSCVGCHKGNARLIKKELAHTGIVKDPRPRFTEMCASCHKTGNAGSLAKAYAK